MKRLYLFFILTALPICIHADEYEFTKRLWQEADSLKKVIENLRIDSTAKAASILNLQTKINEAKSAIETNKQLKDDNKRLKENLKIARKDSISVEQYKDSLLRLQVELSSVTKQMDSLNKELNNAKSVISQNKPLVEQHQLIVQSLNRNFDGNTIEQLFNNSSKEQLLLSNDIYKILKIEVPLVIKQTIECFEAKELCAKKFNKSIIDAKRELLLTHNSKTSKDLALQLQNYSLVFAEADSLWNAIKNEVCKEKIVEDSFTQIQSKRQIWQRTQKFLNKYPNLANEYPYIYEELQKMLRKIWENANNFNTIPAPFK